MNRNFAIVFGKDTGTDAVVAVNRCVMMLGVLAFEASIAALLISAGSIAGNSNSCRSMPAGV